jgi:AraC-like DNA-binding protein
LSQFRQDFEGICVITYNGPILVNASGVELYSHGTAAFPCGCYFNDPRSNEVPFHWHDEYEVVVVQEGELLYLAGGERYVLRKGDAVFVNGGVPHAEQALNDKSAIEGDLVFHPRLLYGDKTTALWINYFRHLAQPGAVQSCALRADGEPWEREAAQLYAKAFEVIAYEKRFFEALARDYLTHATLLVLANHPLQEETASEVSYMRSVDRLKGMISFIEEHYAEDLTIDQIARAGGVSQREAQREFQSVLGVRPMEYLTNHRLFVASQMLKSTDASVGEVARSCGFGSQSYFTKRFRERYGHTPSQHRSEG